MKKEFTDVDFEMFVMPWGKFQGASLEDIPASYLLWLVEESHCPEMLKAWVDLHDEELRLDVLESEDRSEYGDY